MRNTGTKKTNLSIQNKSIHKTNGIHCWK